MTGYYIGVDVGTGSARAGVFDATGEMLASAKRDITLHLEAGDIAEQSGEEIWAAVAACVREAVKLCDVAPGEIRGIGFDATCSLVVVDAEGGPLPVGSSGDAGRNIIVWMDHRAMAEARRINATHHKVLDYVGGIISPEMETPKLLWLKHNLPQSFSRAAHFFDLTDYLTWRASGSLARSICTLTCKWTYLGHERRWDEDYFRTVGLGQLADEGFARIGTEVVEAGTAVGHGLTAAAAEAFGLPVGAVVAAGLIDAHAGGVGTVGAAGDIGTVTSRLGYVLGTSACTMASSVAAAFVPGVWGPYHSAMVPGLWLNEGGQSAAGAAIDQLVHFHPASGEAAAAAAAAGLSLVDWLAGKAMGQGGDLSAAVRLADGLHVVLEFLGNRSPLADPEARGLIAGLGMDRSVDFLPRRRRRGLPSIPSSSAGARASRRWSGNCSPTAPAWWWRRRARPSRYCSGPPCWAPSRPADIRISPPPCRRCRRWATPTDRRWPSARGTTGAMRRSWRCRRRAARSGN